MSSASLSEIYDKTTPSEPREVEEASPSPEPQEAEAAADEQEVEAGEEESVEAKEDGSAEDADKKPVRVPLGELLDERKKRQELERQVAALQGQTQVYEKISQARGEDNQAESVEDEFYKSPVNYLNKTVAMERMNISEFYAKKNHPDYDQAMAGFQEYASSNPSVWQQIWTHPAPAELAYEQGKVFLEAKEFGGSLDSLRDKIRKEVREEVLKEVKANGAREAASQVTKSNADARGLADAKAPKWSGPPTTEELYRKRR